MGQSSVYMLRKRYGHYGDDRLKKAMKLFDTNSIKLPLIIIKWFRCSPCGGFQEKDAQLLVILSIVLNLILSFNPLCV